MSAAPRIDDGHPGDIRDVTFFSSWSTQARCPSCTARAPVSHVLVRVQCPMNVRCDVERPARPHVERQAGPVEKPGGGPAAVLRRDFGLTAAEARVAMALADGLGLEEICAGQGVAMATIRSHLKSIYRKTGTKGQVQLVVLVFKLMRSR